MRTIPLPLRERLIVGAALLLGALGYLLLGTGPEAVGGRHTATVPWELPPATPLDMAPAKLVWAERAPWGSAASGVADAPVAPQSLPMGVLREFDGLKALFAFPGAEPVAVPLGGALLDGGKVTGISRAMITWIDGSGKARQHELFVDPLPAPAADSGN
ncbi:MAG: hypothetical protein ACOH1L_11050 [Thermomonas sp.]